MKINETIHGFTVSRIRHAEELGGDMIEMQYTKNGAKLVWLDRDDDNMTFAVGFCTVPHDDTGVFHILEHSVLNGSEKFPTKEPFVDLLKSSLQTFLNALTFADKTMYPVSSRNRRDFLNLTDVYLDAVFHPRLHEKQDIFRQEGWHYEIGDDGKLTRSGVVYSEMKGAYTSVDRQMYLHMQRLLFPDHCYGCESGGTPEGIPQLTYEQFTETHKTFYHPSNAYIFLDGKIDLDATLKLIDSYLCAYEPLGRVIGVPDRKPVREHSLRSEYEIAPDAPTENKGQYAQGFVYGTYDDKETALTIDILSDILCGTNESILTRAILDEDLAESVSLSGAEDEIKYFMPILNIKNTDEAKVPDLRRVIRSTLENAVKNGLDADKLTASINSLEFMMRERETGGTPKGIVYSWVALSSWLYGGDPMQNLVCGDIFDRLRAKIGTGYFEDMIRKIFLDNPDSAEVYLAPSVTLGEKKRAALDEELKEIADSLSDERKAEIKRDAEALLLAQRTPDRPEDIARLPVLPLDEVGESITLPALTLGTAGGRPLMVSPQNTTGIVYGYLFFNASDLEDDDLSALSFMTSLLGELPTARHDTETLQTMVKTNMGAFSSDMETFRPIADPLTCTPYAYVSFSLLEAKENAGADILSEIVNETLFTDTRRMTQEISQRRIEIRERILASGTSCAVGRVNACLSSQGYCNELTGGYSYYKWLTQAEKKLGEDAKSFCDKLTSLARRVFTRDRLITGLIGHPSEGFGEKLASVLPSDGVTPKARSFAPLGERHEAIIIPSGISFTASGTDLTAANRAYHGSMSVAATSLSYDYLWNVIRVQNGAYGAGMRVNTNGILRFTTYRDPNAAHSLDAFREAGNHLAAHLPSRRELDNLIIATVGETDPLLSARMSGKYVFNLHMTNVDADMKTRFRREMLTTSEDDLKRFGTVLSDPEAAYSTCVIGGEEAVKACGDRLTDVETLI